MTEEAVVAGGGLAGAAVAWRLARAGRRVLVLERETAPADKICGEFLSGGAVRQLAGLGIDPGRLGAAPIFGVRLVRGARAVAATLPFPAFGLSRRSLDAAVLERAAAAGAEIRHGVTVTMARPGAQPGAPIRLDLAGTPAGLGEMRADALFLATGKHDLRGLRRQPTGPVTDLVGFKTHLRLEKGQRDALAGHVELVLLPDGYAGLQSVESGMANLCLLVARERLLRAGGSWEGLLADLRASEPHLRARLAGAEPVMPRPLAIARVPYGYVHAADGDLAGVFRVGDQMGVTHSFTGDGLAIALYTAASAASCWLDGLPAAAHAARVRRDIAGQMHRAALLHRIGATRPGQALLVHVAAICPGALGLAARLTRVPMREAA